MMNVDYKDEGMKEVQYNTKPVNLVFDGMTKCKESILSKPPNHSVYRKEQVDNVKVSV